MLTGTIPEDIIEGLLAVRDTGQINMFNRKGIIEVAEELGLDDTADWMRDKANCKAYLAWFFGRQDDR